MPQASKNKTKNFHFSPLVVVYIKNCRQSRCRHHHHHRAIMGREEKSIRMVECL